MRNRLSLFKRGDLVIFHRFDGQDYTAHVEQRVTRGVIKILYLVKGQPVTAYVSDPSRIVGGQ